MVYEVLTLQQWNEYSQEDMDSSINIINAALTPYIATSEETRVVIILNNERIVLCALKPFRVENKIINCKLNKGDSVTLFLEGENDVDLLIEK